MLHLTDLILTPERSPADSADWLLPQATLALLSRVRDSYRRQASEDHWLRLDGERPRDAVSADVVNAVETRLSRP